MIEKTEELMHEQFDHMYHIGHLVLRKFSVLVSFAAKNSKERELDLTIGIPRHAST